MSNCKLGEVSAFLSFVRHALGEMRKRGEGSFQQLIQRKYTFIWKVSKNANNSETYYSNAVKIQLKMWNFVLILSNFLVKITTIRLMTFDEKHKNQLTLPTNLQIYRLFILSIDFNCHYFSRKKPTNVSPCMKIGIQNYWNYVILSKFLWVLISTLILFFGESSHRLKH